MDIYYPIRLKLQPVMFTRLYLHIPFCLRKCGYCAFNSQELQAYDLNDYVTLLLEEMRLLAATAVPDKKLDSIYFGGGTPSLLSAEQVKSLIEQAAVRFGLDPLCEITLEANPGTIDQTSLTDFRLAGVNRISLGIQSFDNSFLSCLGRVHNSDQSRKAFLDAREAGFNNIGLDLMHSLPSQNIGQWEIDLQHAIQLSPEHLSIYGLTVEDDTPFSHRYPYGSAEIPDDDSAADMFEIADDLLTGAGYEHYEIANYARSGYRSRHNSGYWRRDGYLGLGVEAHSYLTDGNGVRTSNLSSLHDYAAALDAGHLPLLDSRRLSESQAVEEFMFLGLRMSDGVSMDRFENTFGIPCRSIYGKVIDELVRLDLLLVDATGLRLTRRGMLLSNQVFARFLL